MRLAMRSRECGDSRARNASVSAGSSRIASVMIPTWAKSKIGAFLSVLMATPERIPVTDAEVDVFEAWFGDLFDELFGPCR